jgi:hypothetical protein
MEISNTVANFILLITYENSVTNAYRIQFINM